LRRAKKNLPIFTPGWEDSTLGNIFVGQRDSRRRVQFPSGEVGRGTNGGADRMVPADSAKESIGFFQIAGGIAGISLYASCR